tara:strand:+ start:40 stop:732 length:693 start_codon:yes stop_codon:yes gene_type:complete
MCNARNEQIVNDVVNGFLSAQKQFTAWDVTSEARNRGADEYHAQLKGVVHSAWANGVFQQHGYTRQTIDIPGVSIPPWLYYPDSTDPQEYLDALDSESTDDSDDDDDDTDYIAPPVSSDGTDTAVAVAVATAPLKTKTRAKRYNVPQKLINALGWTAGTEIGVWLDNNQLMLSSRHHFIDSVAKIRVNEDSRIRLNPQTFNLLPTGSHITAEIGAAEIGANRDRIIIRRK